MKRILIVDDAIDMARLLQDTLKLAHPDIPTLVVPSAEEALLESTRLSFDLLVTDLRLPGMSGLELIRKIRVRQPHLKVILITGLNPEDRLAKQVSEVPVDLFLRKPITASAFLDAVEDLLDDGRSSETPEAEPALKGGTETPTIRIDRQSPKTDLPEGKKGAPSDAVMREMAAVMPGEPITPAPKQPRKGTGPLPGTAVLSEPEGLSAILSRLRGSLGAQAVILLDERGRPVAQAGDLSDTALEDQLIQPVMSSLSAGARISYLLGQPVSQAVQAYRGAAMDLAIAPVGQYVLLMALHPARSALRLALAFEEALTAQAELTTALEGLGLHVQLAVESGAPEVMLAEMGVQTAEMEERIPEEILKTPLGQDPSLEKFEELFTRKKTGQLHLEDPDAFWEGAAKGETQDLSQTGVLSFEQAQKLGILPAENKE